MSFVSRSGVNLCRLPLVKDTALGRRPFHLKPLKKKKRKIQHRDSSLPGWVSELAEQLKTRPFSETSDVSVAEQW